MDPMKLLDWLLPANQSAEAMRRWRVKIAVTLTFLITGLALASVLLPWWLSATFMDEATAQGVHDQILQEMNGVKGSIDKLVVSDEERARREKLKEIREVRTAILDLSTRACLASGPLRQQLNTQAGELRSQYMALTNSEFPPTPCSDLVGTDQ